MTYTKTKPTTIEWSKADLLMLALLLGIALLGIATYRAAAYTAAMYAREEAVIDELEKQFKGEADDAAARAKRTARQREHSLCREQYGERSLTCGI